MTAILLFSHNNECDRDERENNNKSPGPEGGPLPHESDLAQGPGAAPMWPGMMGYPVMGMMGPQMMDPNMMMGQVQFYF